MTDALAFILEAGEIALKLLALIYVVLFIRSICIGIAIHSRDGSKIGGVR